MTQMDTGPRKKVKKSAVGFILIIVIGILGILAIKYIKPILFEKSQRSTSDAAGSLHTIRIGGDNYLGYWFITSPEMRKMAARKGLQMDFTDDGGAYADRLAAFDRGDYEFSLFIHRDVHLRRCNLTGCLCIRALAHGLSGCP